MVVIPGLDRRQHVYLGSRGRRGWAHLRVLCIRFWAIIRLMAVALASDINRTGSLGFLTINPAKSREIWIARRIS